MQEEEYLNEFYGPNNNILDESKPPQDYHSLKEENNELNDMIKSLISEVSTLRNQISQLNAAEERRKSNNQSILEPRSARTFASSPMMNNLSLFGKLECFENC